jgi:hypothetical protein
MSKIDRSKFVSHDNCRIHEYNVEFETGDPERLDPIDIEIPGGATKTVALFEMRDADVTVTHNEGGIRESAASSDFDGGQRRLFTFGNITTLTLRFLGGLGGRIRAVIIVFLRKLQEFPNPLTCLACKKLMRAVLEWILIATGHGVPILIHSASIRAVEHLHDMFTALPDDFVNLLQEFSEQFREALHKAVDAVRGTIDQVSDALPEGFVEIARIMFDPLGAIAAEVCRILGACAE